MEVCCFALSGTLVVVSCIPAGAVMTWMLHSETALSLLREREDVLLLSEPGDSSVWNDYCLTNPDNHSRQVTPPHKVRALAWPGVFLS